MNYFSGLLTTLFERTTELLPAQFVGGKELNSLCQDLLSAKGEVSGIAIAEQIFSLYRAADDGEKLQFFNFLIEAMDFDPDIVTQQLKTYVTSRSPGDYDRFIKQAEPPRRTLFKRLNEAPAATNELVSMRRDLLGMLKENPHLAMIDIDLRELFISWFNRGFLVLRPINWQSPAHILEKIIAYEAVHEISSWDDLRRRLAPADRRCFAFFHPAMPEEPLIFVEVALTDTLPGSIQDILADDRSITPEEKMDYAVFYSISNCQKGLAGISFGNSLIKTVASELNMQLPQLKHFITLSPLPGLAGWLEKQNIRQPDGTDANAAAYLQQHGEEARALAAAYLIDAKRSDGMPVDQVSRFHLGNGAIIHEIHDRADLSPRGQKQSYGLMVNYLYERDNLVHNHEIFVKDGTVIARSKIKDLAKKIKGRLHQD